MQYSCNQLPNASLLMSEANFKELLPILPEATTSAAVLAYVDPCRYERRCFYYPNDAEIVPRHDAYQGIRLSQSMSQTATAALHIIAQQRSLKEYNLCDSIVHSFAYHNLN